VKSAIDAALTPAKLVIDGTTTAVNAVIDAVKALIDWIAKIDFPDINLPGNPFGRPIAGGGGGGGAGTPYTQAPLFPGNPIIFEFHTTVEGDTDPDAAAQRIIQKVSQYLERNGQTLAITA
jgi:hypothetical protein